ncbi:hypothetical protein [Elizabethkingia ursingii]
MNIKKNLVKFNENSLPENFVALTTQIEGNEAKHAGILIRHKSVNYLHHFPGGTPPEVIEDFNGDGYFIYKIVDFIDSDDESDVGAFLAHCKRICSNSDITYSYIADGSTYDDRGRFISSIGLPEFGTCVGFCVNTITSTMIDLDGPYFELDDWDDSDLEEWVDGWSMRQANNKYPDLDWTLYNAFKKRIKPIEYLTSAFINSYPITKESIGEIEPAVQESINEKF